MGAKCVGAGGYEEEYYVLKFYAELSEFKMFV